MQWLTQKKVLAAVLIGLIGVLVLSFSKILVTAGQFLVMESPLSRADAVVVLNTGVEYYPRLIEAAEIYRNGWAETIVVNGNRKTDTLRELESMGFSPACHWCDNHLRILALFGIPKTKIQCISAEDVYDTVSEAAFIGKKLLEQGVDRLIITTSKSHTRRAFRIWRDRLQGQAEVLVAPAGRDPFQPEGWWKSGRQVRWVLAEYGAWLYYFWKQTIRPADALPSVPDRQGVQHEHQTVTLRGR